MLVFEAPKSCAEIILVDAGPVAELPSAGSEGYPFAVVISFVLLPCAGVLAALYLPLHDGLA